MPSLTLDPLGLTNTQAHYLHVMSALCATACYDLRVPACCQDNSSTPRVEVVVSPWGCSRPLVAIPGRCRGVVWLPLWTATSPTAVVPGLVSQAVVGSPPGRSASVVVPFTSSSPPGLTWLGVGCRSILCSTWTQRRAVRSSCCLFSFPRAVSSCATLSVRPCSSVVIISR